MENFTMFPDVEPRSKARKDMYLGTHEPNCSGFMGAPHLPPARRWNNAVHPQVFNQLSIMVPAMNTVFNRHAQPRRRACRPRRDLGCWIDGVRACHTG